MKYEWFYYLFFSIKFSLLGYFSFVSLFVEYIKILLSHFDTMMCLWLRWYTWGLNLKKEIYSENFQGISKYSIASYRLFCDAIEKRKISVIPLRISMRKQTHQKSRKIYNTKIQKVQFSIIKNGKILQKTLIER